jgi:mannitol-specific phosphotransferase system IIBC component
VLGKDDLLFYNSAAPGTVPVTSTRNSCVYETFHKERLNMKKLLTLMFAVALSLSLSSFAFAQDKMDDKKMDKKEEKKDKKEHKKKEKKEKKEDMKKEDKK